LEGPPGGLRGPGMRCCSWLPALPRRRPVTGGFAPMAVAGAPCRASRGVACTSRSADPEPKKLHGNRRLAQRLERRPDLGCGQFGFFPGGEVAALVYLVEVAEAGVRLLGAAARGPEDLARERGEAGRELDLRASLTGRTGCGLRVLPVRPARRGPGARQPVQRDVVEDVVPGQAAGRLPAGEGAGDLVVGVGVVVEHPGRQGDG